MNAHRLTALTVALVGASLLAPAVAHADAPYDEGPYDEGAHDGGADYDDAGEPTAVEKARAADASIDRGFLTSHAETIGAGNWSINSYELFFLGVTHAFTDDFQIAFTTALPVVEDFPFFLAISPKFVLHRSASTVVALRGLIWWGTLVGDDDGGLGTFNGGVNLDHYFDGDGRFALHASVSLGGAFGTGIGSDDFTVGSGVLFQIEGGFSLALGRVLKLLFEVQTFALNTNDGFEFAPIVLLNYGIRFFGEDLAADLGFFKPIGDTGDDPFIMGFPFVAFSARL